MKDTSDAWHNSHYEELQTAKAWGLTPSQWRAASVTDREEMIAEQRATSKLNALLIEQANK